MLKGISPLLSPKLLKVLCEMGHSDRIVLADCNFPAASIGKNAFVIYMPGVDIPSLLEAILTCFPLDDYVESPVTLMKTDPKDDPEEVTIWSQYHDIIEKHQKVKLTYLDRLTYYEAAKTCYAVVATGETESYANIILQKGTV